MIRSHLPRVRIRSPTNRLLCCDMRLLHGDDNNNTLPKVPKDARTKLHDMSNLRSTRSVSIVPNTHKTQFISEEAAGNSAILTYEKANLLLNQRAILERGDSPFRLMLLNFLELELLKVDALHFDDLNKLVAFILKMRRNWKRHSSLLEYFDEKLSNTSITFFNMIYHPKYTIAFMNKEIELRLMDKEIQTEEKIGRIYHLLHITNQLREQFKILEQNNDQLLIIHFKNMEEIMKILSRSDYLEFFIKLMEYDCQTISSNSLSKLRYELSHGQPYEQEVFEFGALLKLEDKKSLDFMKKKLLNLYSFDMIRQIVVKHIKEGNTEKVEFYMEYLLAKYTMRTSEGEQGRYRVLTTKLYEVLTYHAVRLKNYASAIDLLKTIKQNGIKVTPKLLHILTASFRKKKMYDAVIVMLNKMNLLLDEGQNDVKLKNMIAAELFITLRQKFPDNPKVLVSQFMSIYEGSEVMLNQLGLLSYLYNGTVEEIGDLKATLPTLFKAEVSDFFKITNGFPSIENMTELYIAILNHAGFHQHKLPVEFILRQLFEKFKDYVVKVQTVNLPDHPFSKNNIDEGIVNVFVKRTIQDVKNPELASTFLKAFLQNCDFKRFDGYAASLIVYYHKYADHYELDELLNIMKKLNSPLGFHAITAIILRNERQGDYTVAYEWYKKLLELENTITHFGLIQVIKKHNWELPENFDKSLLETEYMMADERKEVEFAQYDEIVINDPSFVDELSDTLDKIKSE